MSKKDFEIIAAVMNNQYRLNKDCKVSGLDKICVDLAHAFELTNERFKRELFLTKCGYNLNK